MSNFVIILGDSGCGKSTSIKGLDPKETFILNVLGKRLPFKGSNSMYNKENNNLMTVSDYATLLSCLNNINEKAPHRHQCFYDVTCRNCRI